MGAAYSTIVHLHGRMYGGLGSLAHIWRISQILGLGPLEGSSLKCPEDRFFPAPHGGAVRFDSNVAS